ncbi:MAG: ribonuclease HII [Eubacteriales bacterium]|nr:ribonuclease HII [Eubacteriales bacterium]
MRKLSEEKIAAERERLSAMHAVEKSLYAQGFEYVIGVDEVGRGPLCGPVTAAACILPRDCEILFLNDSKKLSEKKRELLYDEIKEKALAYGIASVSPARIDEINILQATFEAMREAVSTCCRRLVSEAPEAELPAKTEVSAIVLVDGDKQIPKLPLPQQNLIKGDANALSVAAASILAKVTRDRLMYEYDSLYPGYEFGKNKGYGTKAHYEGLKTLGITPIHRRSFLKNLDLHE